MQIIKLNYYIPKKQDIIHTTSGIRPYRQKGIRLQQQNILHKSIFHNYGHGGAGLSLAYGCCHQIIQNKFITTNHPKTQPIAILGAGIMGLTTALLLIQAGYQVNLYADIYPFDKNQYKPEITSTVAAGYWMPIKVGNKNQTKKLALKTWNHYKDIYQLQQKGKTNLGISLLPAYVVDFQQGYMEIEGIIQPKDCFIHFGDGNLMKAKTFNTFIIQGSFYYRHIIQTLKSSNRVKFINTKLNTFEDVLKLQEKVIFNCLGFNSYQIFNDQFHMKAIKGHIICFKNQANINNFILFLKNGQNDYILQVPHPQSQRLNLGITFQQNKINPFPQNEQIQKIFNNSKNYFQNIEKRMPNAKL